MRQSYTLFMFRVIILSN